MRKYVSPEEVVYHQMTMYVKRKHKKSGPVSGPLLESIEV